MLYCIKYTHTHTHGDLTLPLLGLLSEPKIQNAGNHPRPPSKELSPPRVFAKKMRSILCAYSDSELDHNIRKKTELRILRHISSLTQDVAIDSRCMMLTLVITLKTSSGVRAKSQQQMKQCIQVQLQNTNTLRTHCTQYSSRCPV